MHIALGSLALFLGASMAQAGAWNREQGQLFLSSGANIWVSDRDESPMYYDTTIYGEYGLTDQITIGVDYFAANRDTIYNSTIFAQFTLGDTSNIDRFSAHFGLGARSDLVTNVDYTLRGGLSWGRGLPSGWLGADTSATYSQTEERWSPKADFTWGYNATDRWSLITQVQTGQGFDGTAYAKFAPSVIYSVTDAHRISLGAVQPIAGLDDSSIRLSIWSSF